MMADKCIIILSRDFTSTDRVSSIRNVISFKSLALNQGKYNRKNLATEIKAF